MKNFLVIIFAAAVLASCGGSSSSSELETSKDSLSYAMGLSFGQYLQQLEERYEMDSLDMDIVKNAMLDAMDSTREMSMDMATAQAYFNAVMEKQESAMRQKEMSKFEGNKAAGQKFLEENKKQAGVTTTASGLEYKILKKGGSGKKPLPTDKVKVHYTLSSIDGQKIQSSLDGGEPVTFQLNQVIPGWTEGMQLLEVGDKAMLYVPQELGYGENSPRGSNIAPYSTLVFEIEFLEIVK
jgi:FKBP-type peptidyl-prolyl cis-trans isomerase